jgi:hypothetical protein
VRDFQQPFEVGGQVPNRSHAARITRFRHPQQPKHIIVKPKNRHKAPSIPTCYHPLDQLTGLLEKSAVWRKTPVATGAYRESNVYFAILAMQSAMRLGLSQEEHFF